MTDTLTHEIVFTFRGYRCRWICSCGKSSTKHTTDTFLAARRASNSHLEKVNGDLNQPFRIIPFT